MIVCIAMDGLVLKNYYLFNRRINQLTEEIKKPIPMTGWKTKTAAFLFALGTSLIGLSEGVPNDNLAPWIRFAGMALDGLATAFGVWGIGHKLEKNKNIIVQKKTVPYYIEPMSEEEFELIKKIRQKKSSKVLDPPTL